MQIPQYRYHYCGYTKRIVTARRERGKEIRKENGENEVKMKVLRREEERT